MNTNCTANVNIVQHIVQGKDITMRKSSGWVSTTQNSSGCTATPLEKVVCSSWLTSCQSLQEGECCWAYSPRSLDCLWLE